jgi:hypothetical protein
VLGDDRSDREWVAPARGAVDDHSAGGQPPPGLTADPPYPGRGGHLEAPIRAG